MIAAGLVALALAGGGTHEVARSINATDQGWFVYGTDLGH